MGLTREETSVEFTNIESTTLRNSEHRTSLLPEVKEFALGYRNITAEYTSISARIKEKSTGGFTFINTICKSVVYL